MLRLFSCATLIFSACTVTSLAAPEAERIELSSRHAPNDLTRVTIEIEAGGHNLVRAENDADTKQPEQKLPMSVSAKLQYDERAWRPSPQVWPTARSWPFDITTRPRPSSKSMKADELRSSPKIVG